MRLSKHLTQTVAVALLALPTVVSADTFGFYRITSNSPTDSAAQFSVVVEEAADNVSFTFYNDGSVDGAIATAQITEIYFDDAPPGDDPNPNPNALLADLVQVINSEDAANNLTTNFTENPPTNPAELPSASAASPAFVTTNGFSADSGTGSSAGVGASTDPIEYVSIVFGLQDGITFNDVIDAMTSGALRAGIHVRSLDGNASDSFVSTVVPIPAAAWLFGSALFGLAGIGYRRRGGVRLKP